ncbi:TetR/AcrR family transcriptional regulator [Nitrospirillum iridis]|uniref:AcrR family transcriptional regulator n=1 Tax=Nitrospirillum iridis TaxID=765888 RepID=A0A7X0EFL1_9PROT|nr:TetR/AcrR family transcriptional regulator [Nitrospirillum iridis]MBB6255118.1 AcrR family transcriptional regulator [Nitrospirillum iridis]
MAPVGRPRSDASHAAILKATYELLQEEGLARLTLDKVARRAGASRSTLYRWWPSRGAIAMEATLDTINREMSLEPQGDNALAEYRRLLKSVARAMRGGTGAIIAGILAECQRDPETLRLYKEKLVGPRRAEIMPLLQRGLADGSIRADVSPQTILDMTFGAIYHQLLLHIPTEDAWMDGVIDILVNGIAAKPSR